MRYANDAPMEGRDCALLTVSVRSEHDTHVVQAVACLNEWAATPALNRLKQPLVENGVARFTITHVPTGRTALFVTLTERQALSTLGKLRDVRVDASADCYERVLACFPKTVRDRQPPQRQLSPNAKHELSEGARG